MSLRRLLRRIRGTAPPTRVVPDSTAGVAPEAIEEARKGTAAADPVMGVTPEGQVLPGAVVDGRFVAPRDHAHGSAPRGGPERDPGRRARRRNPG